MIVNKVGRSQLVPYLCLSQVWPFWEVCVSGFLKFERPPGIYLHSSSLSNLLNNNLS